MPFDVLVDALAPRRELDHSPLFQVLFVLHNLMVDRADAYGNFKRAAAFDWARLSGLLGAAGPAIRRGRSGRV